MKADIDLINRFEEQLNPTKLENSTIPTKVLGYGEISSIFQVGTDEKVVYKRLPYFPTKASAEAHLKLYYEYSDLLKKIGINLPPDDAVIVTIPGRPVVLYLLQERMPEDAFCHRLINQLDQDEIVMMLTSILAMMQKIWDYNRENHPGIETAIDAQLSNWVWFNENGSRKLCLVDTSTPFLRINGEEQLDVDLLLEAVPWFIRWAIKRLNLDDVVSRYYDKRKVLIDLIGNLFKEQRSDLIPLFLEVTNSKITDGIELLKKEEVDSYYKEDKMIWTLFLALRRADRFITTKILRKRYEFILPGHVKR